MQVVKANELEMNRMVSGKLNVVVTTAFDDSPSAQTSAKNTKPSPIKAQQGFTLVELITVILLMSIVAIVAVPRFTGSSGYTEFVMQKRMLAALRNLQLKAIYDTRTDVCYKMIFDTDSSPEFGPTTASYLPGEELASCDSTIDFNSQPYTRSELGEMASDTLTFSALDAAAAITYVQFDNIGKAVTDIGTCSATCTLSFTGESSANVCIASEGYIYAC